MVSSDIHCDACHACLHCLNAWWVRGEVCWVLNALVVMVAVAVLVEPGGAVSPPVASGSQTLMHLMSILG